MGDEHLDTTPATESDEFIKIQQYLHNEHYALWEVIEFYDSYKAPPEETGKGPASESSARKKGRTVAITTEDMHKIRNDIKARTTVLLALPDEHHEEENHALVADDEVPTEFALMANQAQVQII
nr:hypothetical protein [Tanacetum cinerariifolium]